jgi:arabinofuranan 3-O-arabinosyltransferase
VNRSSHTSVTSELAPSARAGTATAETANPPLDPLGDVHGTDNGATGAAPASLRYVVVALVAVSFVSLFLHESGWYIGDTQFFFSWNPSRALSDLGSIWQAHTDLGGPISYGAPLATGLVALFRAVGAEPWVAQRLWYAALLASGCVGTAYVTRYFVPRRPSAALIAGLAFFASPFTVGYFYRSWLFVGAAVAPWFLLAALRGVTSTSRWRWAALPSLLFAASLANVPAVAFATLPVLGALLYLRVSERVAWRAILGWLGRVCVFLVPAMAPFAISWLLAASAYQDNLASTERLVAVAQSSTWSESLRGLGGWLLYWNPSRRLVLPYVGFFLDNWLGVLFAFVPVVAAIGVVVFAHHRARLLFGVLLLVAATLMVGAYPLGASPPFGTLWADVLRDVPSAFAFRSVYKAGAALVLATAVLLGIGWAAVAERGSRRLRIATGTAAALVLLVTSYPFWSGGVLRIEQRLDGDVPHYWTAAMGWLDHQPGDGRALVIPDSWVAQYRWGSTADGDMFSSFMDRDVVLGGPLPASLDDAGDLTQALTTYLSSGHYEPGTLTPIARRLGIEYLVIRNDLDWQRGGQARPNALESLRRDPELSRAASFGKRGENTTRRRDRTPSGILERRLRPVEVLRIPGATDRVRAVSNDPSLLVSGDGAAWPLLAANDMLQDFGPVRYTGRVDSGDLAKELQAGAMVVITDTNRRRPYAFGVSNETLTAAPSDELKDLFSRSGSQSLVTFGDARSINEFGPPRFVGTGAAHEASAAFDGDPDTTWLTGIGTPPLREVLSVRLRRPHVVSSLRIQAAVGDGLRRVRRVRVSFDRGAGRTVVLDRNGRGTLTMPPRVVDELNFRVLKVTKGRIHPYGFAEVSVPGLDLTRRVQVPNDVLGEARRSPRIARAVERAPWSFAFALRRALGPGGEPTLRRRFEVPADRAFGVDGTVKVDDVTTDEAVAQLIGGTHRAAARQSGASGAKPSRGMNVVDGDAATTWRVRDKKRAAVVLTSATRVHERVDLHMNAAGTPRFRVAITSGDQTLSASAVPDCVRDADASTALTCTVPLSDAVANEPMTVHVRTVRGQPVEIAEITVDGVPNAPPAAFAPCRTDLLRLDGEPVPITLQGTPTELLAQKPLPFTMCDTPSLRKGWHTLDAAPRAPISTVTLRTVDGNAPVEAHALATTVHRTSDTKLDVRAHTSEPFRLVSGQAMAAQWTAERGSHDLGSAVELDTQAAWNVGSPGAAAVNVHYSPQTPYRVAVVVSTLALAVAALVVIIDPGSKKRRAVLHRAVNRRAWLMGIDIGVVVFAFGVGGLTQAIVAIAALVAVRREWIPPRLIGVVALAAMALAVVAVVPPIGPSLTPVNPAWPTIRNTAHLAARQAAVLLAVTIAAFARGAAGAPRTPVSEPRPRAVTNVARDGVP